MTNVGRSPMDEVMKDAVSITRVLLQESLTTGVKSQKKWSIVFWLQNRSRGNMYVVTVIRSNPIVHDTKSIRMHVPSLISVA